MIPIKTGVRRGFFYMMSSHTPKKSAFETEIADAGIKYNKLMRAKVDQRLTKTTLKEIQEQARSIGGLHLLNLYPTSLTDSLEIGEQDVVGRASRVVGSGSKTLVEFSVLNSFAGNHAYGLAKVKDRWYLHLV